MNRSQENREAVLAAAMENLKDQAGKVINAIMADLYCDYLPHVEGDTEANIVNRATGVVSNLISGRFSKASDTLVQVEDGYGSNHYISFANHSGLVESICEVMGDKIKNERILGLESEVKLLREALYSRR